MKGSCLSPKAHSPVVSFCQGSPHKGSTIPTKSDTICDQAFKREPAGSILHSTHNGTSQVSRLGSVFLMGTWLCSCQGQSREEHQRRVSMSPPRLCEGRSQAKGNKQVFSKVIQSGPCSPELSLQVSSRVV